jgi:hypothetical protein
MLARPVRRAGQICSKVSDTFLFVMEGATMAHELYTRTNQKIYFAGLALEALGKAEESRAMNAQGLIQAERESALFHLYGALLGLCHEIAGFYRLPQANAPRAETLLTKEVLVAIASWRSNRKPGWRNYWRPTTRCSCHRVRRRSPRAT